MQAVGVCISMGSIVAGCAKLLNWQNIPLHQQKSTRKVVSLQYHMYSAPLENYLKNLSKLDRQRCHVV